MISSKGYKKLLDRFDNDVEKTNSYISKHCTLNPTFKELKNVLPNLNISSSKGNFDVKSVKFNSKIHSFIAHVNLEIEFYNQYNEAVESHLIFHFEEAIVSQYSVQINDKLIHSEIRTKKEAKEEYDDKISEGHFASIQQKLSRDSFTVSLGNVKSKESGKLYLNFLLELKSNDSNLRFTLPIISSIASCEVYEGTVHFKSLSKIDEIVPNNKNAYTINLINEYEAEILVKSTESKFYVDIEFLLKDPNSSSYIIEKLNDEDHALMVSFCPDLSENEGESISEIIFIVDRSGSMKRDNRIGQAKNALQLFLRSIPPGTYFNIIGFGSYIDFMFDESVPYNEENLIEATNRINEMSANLGGTNILTPLTHAIQQPRLKDYPRQIFLLTDGEDSNEHNILSFIKRNLNDFSRIFTFGIGAEASRSLVSGIAKFGRGISEFVSTKDSIESTVMYILSEALKNVLTQINVNWGNINIQYPNVKSYQNVLFSGERIYLYALLKNYNDNSMEKYKVSLIGCVGDQSNVEYECLVDLKDPNHTVEGDLIHKVAANKIINTLEKEDAKNNKERIIELGMKYQITSKYTQFIAISERANEEAQELISVKIEFNGNQSQGSHLKINQRSLGFHTLTGNKIKLSKDISFAKPTSYSLSKFEDKGPNMSAPVKPSYRRGATKRSFSKSKSNFSVNESDSPLLKLLSFANISGIYQCSDDLAKLINLTAEKIKNSLPDELKNNENIWVTILVLVGLEKKYRDERSKWNLSAKKSRSYVEKELKKLNIKLEDMIIKAEKTFL